MWIFLKSFSYLSETLPNARTQHLLTCSASSMTSALAPKFLRASKIQGSSRSDGRVWGGNCVLVVEVSSFLLCWCECVLMNLIISQKIKIKNGAHTVQLLLQHSERLFAVVRFPTRSFQSRSSTPDIWTWWRAHFGLLLWPTETLVSFYGSYLNNPFRCEAARITSSFQCVTISPWRKICVIVGCWEQQKAAVLCCWTCCVQFEGISDQM